MLCFFPGREWSKIKVLTDLAVLFEIPYLKKKLEVMQRSLCLPGFGAGTVALA